VLRNGELKKSGSSPSPSSPSPTPLTTLKPSLLKSTPSSSSSSSTPSTPKSTLWSKSSAPLGAAGATSSVVFDFRGSKSVKAKIALQPAPFGSKPIQKRVWQEINGGDGTDYEYDDSTTGR
ncbi:hypothetical protein TYRP_019744, partial [Tyrophagus putrescentiae]